MCKYGWTKTVVLLVISLSAPTQAYWSVIDLGQLSQDNFAHLSISNDGLIVGDFRHESGNYHAALYDPLGNKPIVDLGTLVGGDSSYASSINDAGQIVGSSIGSGNAWHGTIFDPSGNGGNIQLDVGASDINNNGQIVGGAYLSDMNNLDFPTYLGGLSLSHPGISAVAINDNSQIVGSAGTDSGQVHACFFDSTGGGDNIDLGTLGGDLSMANSVNNNDLIVGDARVDSGFMRATLFDPTGNGNNIDLGTLGGFASYGKAINNHNQIVGYASTDTTTGRFHATLFDASGNGVNIDLNDMIDPLSGWELIYGHDINDNGWIVGWGHNPQGHMHAFLLIPEPSTIVLLGMGGLILRRWKRPKVL